MLVEHVLRQLDQAQAEWPLSLVTEVNVFGSFARGALEPHDVDIDVEFAVDRRWAEHFADCVAYGRNPNSALKKKQADVPVPVMFTLHGWDPQTQEAQDWLSGRLSETYPLFRGTQGAKAAGGLLAKGKITVILDGLDEIPEDRRPAVLDKLSEQATFRLVLLTRSREMAKAVASPALLQGAAAIELQGIDPSAAADYLTRILRHPLPPDWRELTERLREQPGSPLARALNRPLALTLVHDVYRDRGPRDLLDFCGAANSGISPDDIVDHLLDQVLRAAYTPRHGEPLRYDLPTAERALRHIATWMNDDSTRDLPWWHVPAAAHRAPRVVITWLACGLTLALALGLGLSLGFPGWFLGFLAGANIGRRFGRGDKASQQLAPGWWRQLRQLRVLGAGLLGGLSIGVPIGSAGFGYGYFYYDLGFRDSLWFGLAFGLAAGLVTGLVFWLAAGISRPVTDSTSPLDPPASWRSDWAAGLAIGLAPGVVFALVFGLLAGFGGGPQAGLGDGLKIGLTILLAAAVLGLAYSQAWPSALAFAQLAARWKTPVRLMRFLDDARSRKVLRTVGPVYQFRHARLQERLASQQPLPAPGPDKPGPTAAGAEAATAQAGTQARSAKPSHPAS
jgi:hypothetical protein